MEFSIETGDAEITVHPGGDSSPPTSSGEGDGTWSPALHTATAEGATSFPLA